ncbi:MAG: glycosyltransferase family 2 protein [Chthoniobacteraceae bacterium]|jgi:glycosyltransferase involved in cell wall biosynthesis
MGPLVLAIPTFNCARFLPHTLDSLAAQGGSVRWWLQDGASMDGTPGIARQSARPGDTVVSERDRGQSDALNKAFARMGGDIIGFINGDDLLTPGAAAAVLEAFDRHPDIDLIYGEVEWIDVDGKQTGHHKGNISNLEQLLDIYTVWFGKRQWVQPEVFFRRSLWEKAGPFSLEYDLAFDYAFWVQCMLAGARVMRLPRPLARFRIHEQQKSANATKAADEMRKIVRKALALYPPISKAARARIIAQLNYEMYHLAPTPKQSFAKALLRNPSWLRAPAVRRRLLASMRLFGPGKP